MSREYRVKVTGSDTKNGKAEIEWSVADYNKLLSEFEQLKEQQQKLRSDSLKAYYNLLDENELVRNDFEQHKTEYSEKFQSLQDSFNELTGIIDQYIEGGKLHFGIR